jgi:putative addiction module component (TIGR02574 family)
MARLLAQIEEEIQALSTSDKEQLLRTLLEQLDGPSDPNVDQAWLEEARRRDQELEDGHAQSIPADDVFKRLRGLTEEMTPRFHAAAERELAAAIEVTESRTAFYGPEPGNFAIH